jgi:hypothetical protein
VLARRAEAAECDRCARARYISPPVSEVSVRTTGMPGVVGLLGAVDRRIAERRGERGLPSSLGVTCETAGRPRASAFADMTKPGAAARLTLPVCPLPAPLCPVLKVMRPPRLPSGMARPKAELGDPLRRFIHP